jgi:hypothetical protein
MKMVKSLLLGSAAGLVAVAGAQAADLPVKAKPVQYVKICSLYGVGFYYIPGTDMCIKIGGWVRAEAAWGVNNASTTSFVGDLNNRTTGNTWWRIRGYITADARDQTEYGTARAISRLVAPTRPASMAREPIQRQPRLIQWAGFPSAGGVILDFYSQAALGFFLQPELRNRRGGSGRAPPSSKRLRAASPLKYAARCRSSARAPTLALGVVASGFSNPRTA